MSSFDFKKIKPHLFIIAGFFIFSLIYSYPVLQGKVLAQGDVLNWKAMYQESKAYYDSTGINPLWTNSMFGGMPNYSIGIPHSDNYMSYLFKVLMAVLAKPAYFIFLSLFGFYLLMTAIRMDKWLGVIGAIAYALCTNTIVLINAGHDTKVLAIGLIPMVLASLIWLYRGRWYVGGALMAVSLSMLMATNHFQMLYYSIFLFVIYAIGKLIVTLKEKEDLKQFIIASVVALVIGILAVGTSMTYILTTKEYAKTTMRGGESELTINKDPNKKAGGLDKDYAFNWSNGIGETFCLMVPYLYGGSMSEPIEKAPETEALVGGQASSLPLYWGPQNLGIAGPIYYGAVVCFLFLFGMMVIRSTHKWWILGFCILTIMMSWGGNFKAFNYFLFDHLPMYNKFRSPTMILSITQLFFPLIGMWGLMEIMKGKISNDELLKKLKISAGITAGLCLVFAFAGSMFFDYSNPAIDAQLPKQFLQPLKEDRQSLATKSSLTSAVFILLAAALVWGYIKDKLNKNILIGGIGLLILIDLISVDRNYLNDDNYVDESDYENVFAPRPVDQEILKDKDPYFRVLDLSKNVYNDAMSAYFFKNIGGYSPAKMEIYQDLIDVQMGGAQSGGKFNQEVLNMLNTKYIIFNAQKGQTVYQPNPARNGNAWFVNDVKKVNTADEEMKSLDANFLGDTAVNPNAFDSKKTAIIRNDFAKDIDGYQFGKDSTAAIQLTKYGLNDLYFVSNNAQNGLAVFSDIWYPYGWEATVDGKPAEIMRANYVLRALKVPAGKHNIEFHFRPKSYATGNKLTIYSNVLLGIMILGALYFIISGKGGKEDNTTEEVSL